MPLLCVFMSDAFLTDCFMKQSKKKKKKLWVIGKEWSSRLLPYDQYPPLANIIK